MTQQTGIRRELEAAPKRAAGASLRQAIDWRSINWKRANRNVRRSQRRIVEAQQQGKKRKVRKLSATVILLANSKPCNFNGFRSGRLLIFSLNA
jgi:hypothetical protein